MYKQNHSKLPPAACCDAYTHLAYLRCLKRGLQYSNPFLDGKKFPIQMDREFFGGEEGIRTLETLLTPTRFPIVRLRPAQPPLHAQIIEISLDIIPDKPQFVKRFLRKTEFFISRQHFGPMHKSPPPQSVRWAQNSAGEAHFPAPALSFDTGLLFPMDFYGSCFFSSHGWMAQALS